MVQKHRESSEHRRKYSAQKAENKAEEAGRASANLQLTNVKSNEKKKKHAAITAKNKPNSRLTLRAIFDFHQL